MENNGKVFTALIADTVRKLVLLVQEKDIAKEDIVSVFQDNGGQYIMFCYL